MKRVRWGCVFAARSALYSSAVFKGIWGVLEGQSSSQVAPANNTNDDIVYAYKAYLFILINWKENGSIQCLNMNCDFTKKIRMFMKLLMYVICRQDCSVPWHAFYCQTTAQQQHVWTNRRPFRHFLLNLMNTVKQSITDVFIFHNFWPLFAIRDYLATLILTPV